MRSARLLAAMFAASGLFLAFPPTWAGANFVPNAGVTCTGVDFTFTDFPADDNVTITLRVDYPDGTTAEAHAFTYGETDGVRHVDQKYVGSGAAHLTATWFVDTAHEYTNDYSLDCPAPPTTTTTTDPAPTTTTTTTTTTPPPTAPPVTSPPVVVTPPTTLPVGTPEMPGTGTAPWGKIGLGLSAAGIGAVLARRSRLA